MMSHSAPAPLLLRPAWSRQLLLYCALVHVAALAIVAVLPLSWTARGGLTVLVMGLGVLDLATHWWRRMPWSIMEVGLGPDGWELVLATGEPVQARLLGSSTMGGQRLMVLNFAFGGWRRLSLPLAADSLDAELMRRLRVELRAGTIPKKAVLKKTNGR
ncbi:hypothetical protein Thiowin_01146 [Thiorhodovibrio winogradskyi]|uniref:Toxin CptA n=1 Tax=Thiorhodovibrio winogradskyi TaxID=77007 RepID=A0ABZ0S589_9GAMM|nr:hypothetical protein [Thiorhodovibrio winogradskyi]